MKIICLGTLMLDPCLEPLVFWMSKSLCKSLYLPLMITYGLREEIWAFSTDPTWKTSKGQFLPTWCVGAHERGACVHDTCVGVHEASPPVWVLAFSSRFLSFFHLEIHRNLKWIFFVLYYLHKSSKNHWSSNFISLILYVMPWFVNLYDSSLPNTYELLKVN